MKVPYSVTLPKNKINSRQRKYILWLSKPGEVCEGHSHICWSSWVSLGMGNSSVSDSSSISESCHADQVAGWTGISSRGVWIGGWLVQLLWFAWNKVGSAKGTSSWYWFCQYTVMASSDPAMFSSGSNVASCSGYPFQ